MCMKNTLILQEMKMPILTKNYKIRFSISDLTAMVCDLLNVQPLRIRQW